LLLAATIPPSPESKDGSAVAELARRRKQEGGLGE
jgi:hypothetical protein